MRQNYHKCRNILTKGMSAEIKQVTDNLADCRHQLQAYKQGNIAESQTLNVEINDLKGRLAEKQAVVGQSALGPAMT